MADAVVYSKIVEIIDNSQYLAALKKAEQEEKVLTSLREAGGAAAVKALKETEKAQARAAAESAKALRAEQAKAAKEAAYLETLRRNYLRTEEAARKLQERQEAAAAAKAAKGPSEWTLALQANTKAQQDQIKALGDLRGKINLGAESLGKLGAAASLISPELSVVAAGIQKITGVASAATSGVQLFGGATLAAVGPIAGLAAAAYLGLDHMRAGVEELRQESEDLSDALDKLKSGLTSITAAQDELELRRLKATGGEQQAKVLEADAKAADVYSESIKATNEELGVLIERRNALVQRQKAPSLADTLFGPGSAKLSDDIRSVNQEIAAAERRLSEYGAEQGNFATELLVVTDLEEKNAKATKEGTSAKKNAADAERERTKALQEAEAAARASYASFLRDEKERRAEKALSREQDEIQAQAAIAAEARRAEAANERAQTIIDLEESIRAAQRKTQQQQLSAADSLVSTFASAADAIADATADSGGQAAQSAFLVSQALGYSQAAIAALKTGGEVAAAMAPLIGPAAIPVGVAAGAAALAAFAVPIASQQPPAFNDTPGVMQVGSARQDVNFKEGDLFLAAQSMDGLTSQLGAMITSQGGNQTRRPRRSRLRDRLAIDPLALFGQDIPRAIRGGAR